MKNTHAADSAIYDESQFLTLQELARKLSFSIDTIRRHMRAGKLSQIEWVDLLQNGKLRATRESVDAFIEERLQATGKIMNQSPRG